MRALHRYQLLVHANFLAGMSNTIHSIDKTASRIILYFELEERFCNRSEKQNLNHILDFNNIYTINYDTLHVQVVVRS